MASKRIAIVTGANKGLGYAIVKQLCEKFEGLVYLTSRNEERGIEACNKLEKLGFKPCFHQLDITDEPSIIRFCDYIRKKYGKVDLLINNAGIFLTHSPKPDIEKVEETMIVNLFSLVNFCESMIPLMGIGTKIINISSSSGHLSRIPNHSFRKALQKPDLSVEELVAILYGYVESARRGLDIKLGWGDTPYVVSKVGVNAYTFILHRRLAERQISVNCVHPGYVQSDMTKGAGVISADEGAATVIQLALEDRGSGLYIWSNGAVVSWDGPDPRGFIDGKKLQCE